ncbi:hemin uptake protein HemP [Faucicola boevrei]|uniref:hemin uptake protein HemP n=1 Tax=Faucicola boevrei TaxID=346665 RepID=UPI00036ED08B|nr:hemin uptake protein HemP [Moraxella boevrei]
MYHLLNRAIPQNQTILPTLQSNHLFAMTKEIRIQHDGEEYRLRLTRNNRLILTK